MKRILPLLLTAACLSSTVYADPIYLDVSAATTQSTGKLGLTPALGGDANTLTSVFKQLAVFANTSTTQYDTDSSGTLNLNDKFIDVGHASVTDLLPPLGDDEGLGFLSEITVAWSGLTGVTTSNLTPTGSLGQFSQTIAYDKTNTVFDFYFHGDAAGPDGPPNANFGATPAAGDDTGMTDGEKILTIAINGGNGTNTFDPALNFISGSSTLTGTVTYALDNFWWFANGNKNFTDLLGMVVPISFRVDQNTDDVGIDASVAGSAGPAGFGNALFAINSDHDGSVSFQVPEPGTLFLLGLGLVLLPGFRRSLSRKTMV